MPTVPGNQTRLCGVLASVTDASRVMIQPAKADDRTREQEESEDRALLDQDIPEPGVIGRTIPSGTKVVRSPLDADGPI